MNKFKTIKVTLKEKDGNLKDEKLVFKPITVEGGGKIVCDDCYYSKICRYIPDPRYIDNKDYCFTDYCSDLSVDNSGNSTDLCNMVPVEGELERLFADKNIFENIENNNPLYRLSELIDKACPSMCELYDKDHSNCSLNNKLCIFRELFINKSK